MAVPPEEVVEVTTSAVGDQAKSRIRYPKERRISTEKAFMSIIFTSLIQSLFSENARRPRYHLPQTGERNPDWK
jgi:hypothetical protein